ncbi:hypothetical protein L2E82_14582 [Cichorium intybus]|uniref:Uncharacterized protein n=1 Tax=Cichorium intybus TaxID=13427 RepID=A0ACB9F0T3_CICIN|nr:hypothetical protein L2E82_14582 [Cichorium intybus]
MYFVWIIFERWLLNILLQIGFWLLCVVMVVEGGHIIIFAGLEVLRVDGVECGFTIDGGWYHQSVGRRVEVYMSSSHISNIYLVKESNNIIVQFNMTYTQLQVMTQMQMTCDKVVDQKRILVTRFFLDRPSRSPASLIGEFTQRAF